jgi:hypothetical protein
MRVLAHMRIRNGLLLAALLATLGSVPTVAHAACDPIDPSACMLPFPNDFFTTADASTPTGRRISFDLTSMPRNVAGKPIDPTDWNRADGFSPGSEIVTKIAGLDDDSQLAGLDAPRVWDPQVSLEDRTPVAVIDAATGEKQMVWAELDHSIDKLGGTPADRVLIIRPAKNLLEGHRYIVALRLPGFAADPTFANFRDKGAALANPIDEQRRAHFEDLFNTLTDHGFERKDLTQAWDFTVASGDNLAGRMLHIRDDAFAQLGDTNLADMRVEGRAPTFTLSRVIDTGCDQRKPAGLEADLVVLDAECPGGEDGPIAYDVKGTMDVPCYLSTPGCLPVHSHFVLDPTTDLPLQIPGNTMKVDFRCRIPKVAIEQGGSRPSLYGHGLFGGYGEIGQGQLKDMMAEHNFTYCATAWAGMATEDVPNVATILTDLSSFNTLADRVQQGMLNFLYLGRLMIHPDGLCSQAAFHKADGSCFIDTRRLFYDGNSQGGIIGGALTAVAPDFNRATLGVLGMNYSTLLTRSTDFGTGDHPPSPTADDPTNGLEYAYPLYTAYPQFNERQLIFSLMQMLWDRAEPDGYAQHMTDDPYPNTPPHEVMLMAGYGDHQVSNYAAEAEARTVGAKVLKPNMLRPWRMWELDPWTGLDFINGSNDTTSSVLTVWDGGSRPSPLGNVAQEKQVCPAGVAGDCDDDPHEWVRRTFDARAMKSYFLSLDSRIVDTCDGFCDTDQKSPLADYSADPLEGIRHP